MKQPIIVKYVKFYNYHLGLGILFATLVSLIAIVLDVIGISVFIPALAGFISNDANFEIPAALKFLDTNYINFYIQDNGKFLFVYLIVFIFLLKAVVQFIHGFYIAKLRSQLSYKLRKNYIKLYAQTSYTYSRNLNSGYLVGLLSEQIFKITTSVIFYLQFFATGLAVFCYVIIGILVSSNVSIYIAVSGVCLVVIYRYMNQKIAKFSQIFTYNSNIFASRTLQLTRNIKYLVSTNSTNAFESLAGKSASMAASDDKKIGIISAISTSIKEPIILILIVIVIYYETVRVQNPGTEVLLSVVFFYRAFNSAINCQNFYQRFLECTGSVDEYLLSAKSLKANLEVNNGDQIVEFSEQIELVNACVSEGDNKLLNNITLTVRNKEYVGIIGESGAGKSTLLNVLTLLQPLCSGSLVIDGVDSGKLNRNFWRSKIGLVTQEPVIFDGSIKENIMMDFDKEDLNPDVANKLMKVCEITNLMQIIDKSELGIDYLVGENGSNLSGGQRQRLCIARELFHDKEILILDEPTSSLDSESEASIMKVVDNLKGKRTIIVVTHSEKLFSYFDRKLTIKEGKIVSDTSFVK